MLQRYLGNKTSLTGEIVEIVKSLATPGERVCDAFSGSLAVSFALRKAGFIVSANDINLLSWVYGSALLSAAGLPDLHLPSLVGSTAAKRIRQEGMALILSRGSQADYICLGSMEFVGDWTGLIANLFAEYSRSEVPRTAQRTDFYDHYCAEGDKSAFSSSRGSTGRRRYLSAENAAALDRAMNRIRYWHRKKTIVDKTRCLLTAVVLNAVERVANIQGTYHDFPRDFYDPRALKPIAAELPDPSFWNEGPPSDQIGKALDSLEFIKTVPPHAVLYLDPPYNFRQYTSYYFLPNLIAEYPDIDDLDEYFSEIKYVRGQNMRSEFTSTFCSASGFLPSLTKLVESSSCRHVVLSYFNGRNHWNEFKAGTSNRGREELEKFFSSHLFERGSLEVRPVSRLNYQSYGGYKALEVSEYLFVAKKASSNTCKLQEENYAVV